MKKKDDFYAIAADTYNIQRKVYSPHDLTNLTIDERVRTYCSGTTFDSADEIAGFFGIEIPKDKSFDNLDEWDYMFCIIFGAVCALLAIASKEPLSKLHDGEYRRKNNPSMFKIQKWLKHEGQLNDKIQGLGHRVKYGHDVFNLKEIRECISDQKQLLTQAGGGGLKLYSLSAVGKILKHILVADPLSKEGLPIPGHSLFREKLYYFSKHNNELYQKLFTIKTADLLGTGVLTVMCRIYKSYRGISNNQYKYYNINLLANSIAIVFQLLMSQSLNIPSLVKIFIDDVRVCLLSEKIRSKLILDEDNAMDELVSLMRSEYEFSDSEIKLLAGV